MIHFVMSPPFPIRIQCWDVCLFCRQHHSNRGELFFIINYKYSNADYFLFKQSPPQPQFNRSHAQRITASAQPEPKYASAVSLAQSNKYQNAKASKSGYVHPEGVGQF